MRQVRAALAYCAIILAMGACDDGGPIGSMRATPAVGARSDLVVVDDLVRSFGGAASFTDTVEIDFGVPAAQPHLLEGWGGDQSTPDGNTTVWAMGPRSSVWFHTSRPGGGLITFRVMPYWKPGWPQQEITISLNGRPIGKRALAPRPTTYIVETSGEHMRIGRNLLEFEYAYSGIPPEVGEAPPDDIGYAALWHWMRFHGASAAEQPTAHATGKKLIMPPGAGLEFYADLPSGAELSIDGVRATGDGAPRLAVEVAADGEPPSVHWSVDEEPIRIPLGEKGIKRISFTAVRKADDTQSSPVEILAPAIMAPPHSSQSPVPRRGKPERLPHVMIYVIDTLRAGNLGVYGYERPTSPHIDAFANESVVFTRAVAQSSWTRPSVASIFTGLTVRSHGVVDMEIGLAPAANTIAELLSAHGYRTAGFSLNAQVAAEMGFGQGFDVYQTFEFTSEAVEPATRWLSEQIETAAPLMLFVHTIEPHNPYDPEAAHRELLAGDVDPEVGSKERVKVLEPRGFKLERARHRSRFGKPVGPASRVGPDQAGLMALYDAEVRGADAQFGRFLDSLRAAGIYEDSIVVLVADHGEEFYEHGRLTHGMTLYHEQLHIPLIIKFPNGWGAGRRLDITACQVDILPTVLDYAGLPAPANLDGRSLLGDIAGGPPASPLPAYSYINWFGGRAESVVRGRYKLIHNLERNALVRPSFELYDLDADPTEQHDLARSQPIRTGFLRSLMQRNAAKADALEPVQAEVDETTRQRLRALGYID